MYLPTKLGQIEISTNAGCVSNLILHMLFKNCSTLQLLDLTVDFSNLIHKMRSIFYFCKNMIYLKIRIVKVDNSDFPGEIFEKFV